MDGDKGEQACFYAPDYYFYEDGDRLITRKVAEIHLTEGYYGVGIVAHEIQHFLSHWQDAMRWDIIREEWEKMADLAGKLNSEFWVEFYKRYE